MYAYTDANSYMRQKTPQTSVAKLQALCFDVSDIGSLFGATRNIRAYFEEQRKGSDVNHFEARCLEFGNTP